MREGWSMGKECLNCGYERQPEDESEFTPAAECPKCHAIYEKVEKWLREKGQGKQLTVPPTGAAAPVAEEKPPIIRRIADKISICDEPRKESPMNKVQKNVLVVVAIIVFGMLLFPPFQSIWSEGRVYGRGYNFIFNPPLNATVDVGTLLVQWIGVLIVGGIAFFLLKDKQ